MVIFPQLEEEPENLLRKHGILAKNGLSPTSLIIRKKREKRQRKIRLTFSRNLGKGFLSLRRVGKYQKRLLLQHRNILIFQ